MEGQIRNRSQLNAFVAFIRSSAPLGTTHRGPTVSADVAASYGAAIHSVRSREAGYDIAPGALDVTGALANRTWRRQDDPSEDRRLVRALRAAHISAAVAAGLDISSEQGIIDHAGTLTGHNALLRGGEWGLPDGVVGDPRRIITFGSFDFRSPRAESRMRLWLILMIHKIKDIEAKAKPYPTPICRRHDGPFGSDPLCTYDAIALAWWTRRAPRGAPFPTDALGRPQDGWWQPQYACATPLSAPFFTTGGKIYRTSDVSATVRRVASAAGQDPADFGAKSPRSGGATELRALMGIAGADFIKARGRWASDVSLIYQRHLVADQLDASAAVGGVTGADLEELCSGWAQPS